MGEHRRDFVWKRRRLVYLKYELFLFQNFTEGDNWSGFPAYIQQLHNQGLYLIVIFDPAVEVIYSSFQRGINAILLFAHVPACSSVVAVSAQKCGLLPISEEAIAVGEVGYHEYRGTLIDEAERALLVRDLGDRHVMSLRNHGFVVCGESVEHALSVTYHLIIACETQVKRFPVGTRTTCIFLPIRPSNRFTKLPAMEAVV
ncbi:hypothetical protein B9Z55_019007 [Caenorhabditis nigoni]|uniref:Class II aldolase/adducin N-terminal domain-containing protein n=1 Tax=Caenorhabditis nigoni TaxID=1611254 RepID=A0A2G5TGP7_9PELO|nr:hypothetical protein B9Z55_019007 [Caenorhabditis nigoni]